MNWWWPLLLLVGCSWAIPMVALNRAPFGPAISFAVGCLWIVVFLFTARLYDWETRLTRRWGMARMAEWRERLKPRILPPARAALLVMAALSFLIPLLRNR